MAEIKRYFQLTMRNNTHQIRCIRNELELIALNLDGEAGMHQQLPLNFMALLLALQMPNGSGVNQLTSSKNSKPAC